MPEPDCSIWCSCSHCPQGIPPKFLVTISVSGGEGYDPCCGDLSGTYTLGYATGGEPGCIFGGKGAPTDPCGYFTSIYLSLHPPGDENYDAITVGYQANTSWGAGWVLSSSPGANCFITTGVPIFQESPNCDWPSSVQIKPIADKEEYAQCIKEAECVDLCADDAAEDVCPPPPPLGPPTTCCYLDDSECGCEGGESEECEPCEVARPAQPVTIIACCPQTIYACPGGGSSGSGGGSGGNGNCSSGSCNHTDVSASFSHNALAQATTMFSRLRSSMQSSLPSALQRGPGKISKRWGFLNINLGIPNSGPSALPLTLVYNSLGAGDANSYGRGWYLNLALRVVEDFTLDSVRLTNGLGLRWNYISKDGTSGYYSSSGHNLAIKDNGDSTFTGTTSDGTKYEFNSSDPHLLTRIENPYGSIWTFTFAGTDRLESVQDPTGSFTTVTYDGNDTIEKIIDPFGRETLFDVDSSTNELRSMTTPEMCVTSLSYDGTTHQLTSFTSPEGNITTYGYDVDTWVDSIEHSDGSRVTMTYEDWNCTEVEDEHGNITTLIYEGPRQIGSIIQPNGDITTNVWSGSLLSAVADGAGNLTTFTYREAANRLQQVEEVLYPDGGRYTYVYDNDDRVEALIDQNSNHSTLVWDATNKYERIALIDPLGESWSYSYDNGRISGKMNPLGEVTTMHYDAQGNLEAYENPLGQRTSYSYEDGQRKTILNAEGYVTTFLRDSMNRVVQKVDARGYTISYTYNLNGRLTVIENPLGERTTNVYDSRNYLEASINSLGEHTTYTYDSRGNRTSITNPLNETTTQFYDSDDRLIAVENPLGDRTSYAYDAAGNLHEVTNALGEKTSILFDVMNRPWAQIDARGNRTTFSYDLVGNRTVVENALGYLATTSYNSLNQIEEIVDPLEYRTSFTYNAASRLTEVQNARGYTSTTVYDAAGRVHATIDPLGNRTTLSYDRIGQKIAVTNARGYVTTNQYDPVGNLTLIEDPLGNDTTYEYDALNRRISTENALSQTSQVFYDQAGRVSATENPSGYRTTFLYDAAGRRTAVVDAEVNTTTTVYGTAGRPQATVNALGAHTTLVYDSAGRRTELIDANGHITTFAYDPAGNLTEEIDPLGRLTTYTYDALNRQQDILDARNIRTTFNYDPVGRLSGKRFSDDTPSITFSYDPVGNRSQMLDGSGQTDYVYDAVDRLDSIAGPYAAPITYSYDAVGNRAAMTDPDGGLFTYSYDANNRIKTVESPAEGRTTLYFDAVGRTQFKLLPNGVYSQQLYNADGTVQTLKHFNLSPTWYNDFYFQYDRVGNRTESYDLLNGVITTYTYDQTYRLINENHTGANTYNTTHTYDPVGNRLYEDTDGERTTFSYDVANQLDQQIKPSGTYPTTQFVYDNAGNLAEQGLVGTPSGTLTYDWNAENQLIERATSPEHPIAYAYNGDGLRVEVGDDDEDTKHLHIWDQNNLLMEKSVKTGQSPVTQAVYTYSPQLYGNLLGQRRGSFVRWHMFDVLGSAIGLTDSSQALTDTYSYKAYGDLVAQTGVQTNYFRWLGQVGYYNDLSGLHYVRARYYNSQLARWLSEDPIGYAGGWNLYEYVGGKPTVLFDPSGQNPIVWGCAGGAVGSLLTGFGKDECEFYTDLVCDTLSGCLQGTIGAIPGLGYGKCLGAGALIGVVDQICKTILKEIFCNPCPIDWKCALANALTNALGGLASCAFGDNDINDLIFAALGIDVTVGKDVACKVAGELPIAN